MMSPGNPFILGSKGQRSRSQDRKTLPAWVFALLWVLASSSSSGIYGDIYFRCLSPWSWPPCKGWTVNVCLLGRYRCRGKDCVQPDCTWRGWTHLVETCRRCCCSEETRKTCWPTTLESSTVCAGCIHAH